MLSLLAHNHHGVRQRGRNAHDPPPLHDENTLYDEDPLHDEDTPLLQNQRTSVEGKEQGCCNIL